MLGLKSLKFKVTAEDIRRGKPNATTACPIARCLKRQYTPMRISVDTDVIEMSFKDGSVRLIPNAEIKDFIWHFDKDKKSVKPTIFTL